MDLLFLDANILFSAAYKSESPLRRLWSLEVELSSSEYAVEEARRNLVGTGLGHQLPPLLEVLRVVTTPADLPLPPEIVLPDKDRPILQAAIASGATHLITGDLAHFGKLLGKSVGGVRVLTAALYLTDYA